MSGSIQLHPTLGVNPKLTICTRCGKDGDELILIGAKEWLVQCDNCHIKIYGGGPCPSCKSTRVSRIRKIGEHERLPSTSPCKECRKELSVHAEMVRQGGVFFKCKGCGVDGVVKPTAELAKLVRKKMAIAPPDPVGVELGTCPNCEASPETSEPRTMIGSVVVSA